MLSWRSFCTSGVPKNDNEKHKTRILSDRNNFGWLDGLAPDVHHRNKVEQMLRICEFATGEICVTPARVTSRRVSSSSSSFVQIKQAYRTSGVHSEWPPAQWKASHARKSGGMWTLVLGIKQDSSLASELARLPGRELASTQSLPIDGGTAAVDICSPPKEEDINQAPPWTG